MANAFTTHIFEQGPRNAVVQLTGLLDTANEAITVKVDPANFAPVPVGFRIDHIDYSISDGIEVQLFWDATTPDLILPLAGRGRLGFSNFGGLQNPKSTGWTGKISQTTTLLPGGSYTAAEPYIYSLTLELVKQY